MPSSRPPSAHAKAFKQEVANAFAGVKGYVAYLDTIQIITGWQDGARAMSTLNQLGIRCVKGINRHPRMPRTLRIHQPTRAVLEQLPDLLGRFELVRVDLAVDLLFGDGKATQHSPEALQAFLEAHLTQRHHGKRRMGFNGNGAYWAAQWRGRNIAMYSDRPSKITGGRCTHIEFRFYSAKQVRKLGAACLADLLEIDVRELLMKQCALSSLSRVKVEKKIEALINRTAAAWRHFDKPSCRVTPTRFKIECRDDVARRVRSIIARGLVHGLEGGTPVDLFDAPAQVWLEAYRPLIGNAVAQVPFPVIPCLTRHVMRIAS